MDQAEDEGMRAQSVQVGTQEPWWRVRGDGEERGALIGMGLETPLHCAGPPVTAPACHARSTEVRADDIKRLLTLSGLIQAVNEGMPGRLLIHVSPGTPPELDVTPTPTPISTRILTLSICIINGSETETNKQKQSKTREVCNP